MGWAVGPPLNSELLFVAVAANDSPAGRVGRTAVPEGEAWGLRGRKAAARPGGGAKRAALDEVENVLTGGRLDG